MPPNRPLLTLISRHYFTNFGRKTTVHFIARHFVKLGYNVRFISVGRSRLSLCLKQHTIPQDISRHSFTEIETGIESIIMDEWTHPVSSSNPVIHYLTTPLMFHYGSSVPSYIATAIHDSDIVLVECGYGVAYTKTLKELCPNAVFIYFATDPLQQVGLRKEFVSVEQQMLPNYDIIRVAAPQLAERFPAGLNVIEIPQGLEKQLFDEAQYSPYTAGTKNVISIGDMAFDAHTLRLLATAHPDVYFHVFGAELKNDMPANMKSYGEVEFSSLVPFIKYADVGIMPYKMNEHLNYLTKTSLKFLQYSYAGLPIITPEGVDWGRGGIFYYSSNDATSLTTALDNALQCGKNPDYAVSIWDWSECTQALYDAYQKVRNRS